MKKRPLVAKTLPIESAARRFCFRITGISDESVFSSPRALNSTPPTLPILEMYTYDSYSSSFLLVPRSREHGSTTPFLGRRGRGFTKLAGVVDTRGDRGLVAVAERGGGRVRLLHYAPALPPFYGTELTHLHR